MDRNLPIIGITMTKPLVTVALTALAAVALFGCGNSGGSASSTTGSSTSAAGKPLKLAFVTNNASDFWTIARKGTEKAKAELPNVTVEFKIPSDGSAAEQKRIVDDLIATGIDGIAISPKDPANMTADLNKWAESTLLVTQDSDAPDSKRTMYIGTDNVAAGRQAGEEIKKAVPNGGKVGIFVGNIDAQNAKERFQGIQEALKGSNITILPPLTDEADRVRAIANVSDTMVKNPDVACLVGLWSYNGPAILSAVQKGNMVGKVKIVCFDEEADTLKGVKDGAIDATIVQQPFEFGYEAIKNMTAIKGGDQSAIPADKKKIVPTQVINKANVNEFSKKITELRG